MAGGAYIRFKNGNIEIHAPGVIDQKAGSFPHAGPTSLSIQYPTLAKTDGTFKKMVMINDDQGIPMRNQPVTVNFKDGRTEEGLTDSEGLLSVYANEVMDSLRVEPNEGKE